ncbi:MAG: hypothetical protein ACYDEA_12125 [Candidatus Dormibacteria bacterium]
MDWKKLSPVDWVVGAAGLLLVIDLVALPWIDVSYAYGPFGASITASGVSGPDGFLGWLAVLLALAAVADLGLERLTTVQLPELPMAGPQLRAAGAVAALVLVLLEFILHLDPRYLGFGCWLALVAAAVFAVAAIRSRQEGALERA